MRICKIFTEGAYRFICVIKEEKDGTFSCAIEFTSNEDDPSTNVGSLEMSGRFSSAVVALGAVEHYGRALICQHGNLAQYLAATVEQEG
jgi:hypothetical protein